MRRTTLSGGLIAALLAMTGSGAMGGDVTWQRSVYYDAAYPATWAAAAPLWIRDVLAQEGYTVLDAQALKQWMEDRIAEGLPSVVVFSQDVAPDTVAEAPTASCTLRRYLDAGGKVVWYADIPLYYQGHQDGSLTTWGVTGSINILGFNAAGGTWDSGDEVTLTPDGENWGLTATWPSERPTDPASLRVLATDSTGGAAAWVKHYVSGDNYRGFVRFRDTPDTPNIDDLRRLAEFPNQPEPVLGENTKEAADDIVATFLYPWYGNPQVSGEWIHWEADDHNPPTTWSANYVPNYPDGQWNPAVQLYDSSDIAVLRWQDRAMARAGLDIAVASWWGIGLLEDEAFERANYTCKSVQWCIYYELDVVGDPTPQQIYSDIKHVLDRNTPYRNYARIDGKWLVMAYAVHGEDAANRWRQAKQMLAADGYDIYINANGTGSPLFAPDPWDALHHYDPISRRTLTESLIPVDDSHSISPGFWFYHDPPALTRDLPAFNAALGDISADASKSRFIMVETWNEWHEGTSIEPGQRIEHDDIFGFRPTDDNYDFDYIDALAPATLAWQWTTPGHRPAAPPRRLEAEDMVWEPGTSACGADQWRIQTAGARIGRSVELPAGVGDLMFVVRARVMPVGPAAKSADLVLLLDDVPVHIWTVSSEALQDYAAVVPGLLGVHRIELSLAKDPGGEADVDLAIDYLDVLEIGDLNGDGCVDAADLAALLGQWGPCPACAADLGHNGTVDAADLAILLGNWHTCRPG